MGLVRPVVGVNVCFLESLGPFLAVLPSQHLNVFTNLEALWTLLFKVFMEVSLHRHDWQLNATSRPSPLPGGLALAGGGDGLKVLALNPLIRPWSLWQTAPSWRYLGDPSTPVILLAYKIYSPLSLPEFWELQHRNLGQNQIYIFHYTTSLCWNT